MVRHRTRLLDLAVFHIPASILEKTTHFLLLRFHPLLLFTNLPFSPFSFFFSFCFYYKKRFLFCGQGQNIVLFLFSLFSFFNFWFENKDTFILILLIKSFTWYLVLCPSSHMSQFINTSALPDFLLGPSSFFSYISCGFFLFLNFFCCHWFFLLSWILF